MIIAVGCLIQWYEADIIEQYFHSIRQAIEHVRMYKPETLIIVHNEVDMSTFIEQPIEGVSTVECVEKIRQAAIKYDFNIARVHNGLYPYSVSEFRHDFNSNFCRIAELLVWGESDMIAPRAYFKYLTQLYEVAPKSKWISTFSSCKMWDETWEALEHPDFTRLPHSDSKTDWWSVNYDMTFEEMETINEKVKEPTVVEIRSKLGEVKFNGCGLVLTSQIIKSGLNVPLAAFFVHEDSAFMYLLNKVLPGLKQYHFSDVLLVHNRKHALKRHLVANESGDTVGTRRKSNPTYVKANTLSQDNVINLFNSSINFFTWKQVK